MVSGSLRVGLGGFGNVGRDVARRLTSGAVPGVELSAVTARDLDRATEAASGFSPPPEVMPLDALVDACDVVVECATAEAFPEIARATLAAGKDLIALSVAGVLELPEMIDLALERGGRVHIASGTMPGLDMIRCATESGINSVHITSRILSRSLADEPFVLDQGFDFVGRPPAEPVEVFNGTVAEAAAAFPRHFNVAIAVGLAGIGLERTTVQVLADGGIPGNIMQVEVDAEDVGLTMTSRNRPSGNPSTSRIVAPGILAILRRMTAPVVVGS